LYLSIRVIMRRVSSSEDTRLALIAVAASSAEAKSKSSTTAENARAVLPLAMQTAAEASSSRRVMWLFYSGWLVINGGMKI
jgi:hypothetical protein